MTNTFNIDVIVGDSRRSEYQKSSNRSTNSFGTALLIGGALYVIASACAFGIGEDAILKENPFNRDKLTTHYVNCLEGAVAGLVLAGASIIAYGMSDKKKKKLMN